MPPGPARPSFSVKTSTCDAICKIQSSISDYLCISAKELTNNIRKTIEPDRSDITSAAWIETYALARRTTQSTPITMDKSPRVQRQSCSVSTCFAIQTPISVADADSWLKASSIIESCVSDSTGARKPHPNPRMASGVKPVRLPACAVTVHLPLTPWSL